MKLHVCSIDKDDMQVCGHMWFAQEEVRSGLE